MEKEVLTQAEFDALVAEEMVGDQDAGGDPATSRAYAERWAHSLYDVKEVA